MKLSTRARYALRAMVAIARNGDARRPVTLTEVSETTRISRRYLEQVVLGLKRASLLRGLSGRAGGYLLARSPDQITVRQIVEAAIGPINIVDCVQQPEQCLKADLCECRWLYQQINDGITSVLESLTLAQLASRGGRIPAIQPSARGGAARCPSSTTGAEVEKRRKGER